MLDNLQRLLTLVSDLQINALWLGVGSLLLLVWLWWSHKLIRRTLGHVQFRGRWFDEQQARILIKTIHEDAQRGNRVMKEDELNLLRQYPYFPAMSRNRNVGDQT